MASKKKAIKRPKPVDPASSRPDGRRQLLLYMAPDLIADLKRAAMIEGTTAFNLVERAVRAYLKDYGPRKN